MLQAGPARLAGAVGTAGWHRDGENTHGGGKWWRWGATEQQDGRAGGGYEQRPYTTPLGGNFLIYLQDMTPDSGPLRLVPRSHLTAVPTPEGQAKLGPLPGTARANGLQCQLRH